MHWREAEREYTDEVIGESTLPRMFEESVARNESRIAQRYKGGIYDRSLVDEVLPLAPSGEFETLTYGEMAGIVRNLAAGFREQGIEAGDRVGIFAETRMEWAQCDFGLLAAGAVVTTIYAGSSPNQVEYLLSDPETSAVVVENEARLERVLEVEDQLDLSFMVVMDRVSGYEDREDILTLGELYDLGAEADRKSVV